MSQNKPKDESKSEMETEDTGAEQDARARAEMETRERIMKKMLGPRYLVIEKSGATREETEAVALIYLKKMKNPYYRGPFKSVTQIKEK